MLRNAPSVIGDINGDPPQIDRKAKRFRDFVVDTYRLRIRGQYQAEYVVASQRKLAF